jgi:hypothetical protein
VRRYNGPGNGWDGANDLALDNLGNVYVAGHSYDTTSGYDYTIIKYSRTGNTIWKERYNGWLYGSDNVTSLAVDNFNNVYVTGISEGSGSFADIATIKYSQTVGIEEGNDKLKMHNVKLLQNRPNPFNKLTAISYIIPNSHHASRNQELPIRANHVSLKVYDITGRLVETLVDELQDPGVYQVYWDSRILESGVRSGIYFYRLSTSGFTDTKKLILLK